MSVTLKKVYIRHFGTIKEAELDLPGPGLCLVVGHNKSSDRVESIAAGKTLLGEAISRTLLGVPGRFAQTSAYSADGCGNKNMLVKLDCDLDGRPLTVWSGYKCKDLSQTGEGLRFQLGDSQPEERGKIQDTRTELSTLLGLSADIAAHTVHLDGLQLRFDKLSERELVELVVKSTNIKSWTSEQRRVGLAVHKAHEELVEIQTRRTVATESIEALGHKIQELDKSMEHEREYLAKAKAGRQLEIDDATTEVSKIEKKLEEIKESKKKLKQKLKALEDAAAKEQAKLDLAVDRLTSDLRQLDGEVVKLSRLEASARTKLHAAEKSRSALIEPDVCPTCKKPWDKTHSKSLLEEKDRDVKSAEEAVVAAEADLKTAKLAQRTKARERDVAVSNSRSVGAGDKTAEISRAYERDEEEEDRLSGNLAEWKSELEKLKLPISEDKLKSMDALRDDAIARRSSQAQEVKTLDAKEAELRVYASMLSYLYNAFGPSGLSNLMLEDSLVHVNRVLGHLSATLTGGIVELSMSATKMLANSDEKPALTINVLNRTGSKRFAGASKGEGGISNLILAEALYSLGRIHQKARYRWLDEAVNSQDSIVRGSVYGYIRAQAKAQGVTAFVVDHSRDVEAHADSIIIAEKSAAGFTTYRRA